MDSEWICQSSASRDHSSGIQINKKNVFTNMEKEMEARAHLPKSDLEGGMFSKGVQNRETTYFLFFFSLTGTLSERHISQFLTTKFPSLKTNMFSHLQCFT